MRSGKHRDDPVPEHFESHLGRFPAAHNHCVGAAVTGVACRLFDEGTDWVPCTRLHNTDACEKSVTLAVQRFFRPLRHHPEKRDV